MTPPRHEQRAPPDVDDGEIPGMTPGWHLSRQVPIAFIVTFAAGLLIQSAAIYSWGLGMNFRVEQLEKAQQISAPLSERMVKIETKFDGVAETLTEIKNLLRQVPTRAEPRAN